MFKSIGKAISSAWGSVKSALAPLTSSGTGYNPLVASAFDSVKSKPVASAYGPNLSFTPRVPTTANTISVASSNPGTGRMSGTPFTPVTSTPLPVNINAGQQKVFGGSGGGSGGSFTSQLSLGTGGFLTSAPTTISVPTTISARTLGAQTGGTGGTGGASLQSTGTSISNPVTLSSNPTSVNPTIDNTRLAGVFAGVKDYNPKTGQFEDAKQFKQEQTLEEKIKEEADILKQYMPEKQNVFDDPQVIEARNKRQQLQQALQVPTAELNAIIAKQNQDLLQLRQTGSQEGVTEAVYGGQQSAINYNAAIRALPLQASIAAIQGDLKLAQDYLTELTAVKKEQINNQYEANVRQFDAIKGLITKEEQRAYDEIKDKNERERKRETDLVELQQKLLMNATARNAPQTVKNRIANSKNGFEAIEAAGEYGTSADNQVVKLDDGTTVVVDKNTGAVVKDLGGAKGVGPNSGVLATLPTSIQGKVISIANSFGDKPNIKKYIEAIDSNNIVRGIDPKSTNPADHQQIVYAFAKALDPDSAVKEGEYDTIKKYAQSSISKYGKEITNAINGTGFLSEKAIEDIQTTINNTLESRKTNYLNSVKETKKIINNIAGTDVADEIMIDYSGGIKNESGTNTKVIDYTSTLDNIFK